MKKLVAALVLAMSLSGCANLHQSANTAIVADTASTVGAIQAGVAVEGNLLAAPFYAHGPWPVLVMVGARIATAEKLNKTEEPTRTTGLSLLNSVTWAAVANNVAVIIGVAHAPVIGVIAGISYWKYTADQREFMEICAKEKLNNPALKCVWNG